MGHFHSPLIKLLLSQLVFHFQRFRVFNFLDEFGGLGLDGSPAFEEGAYGGVISTLDVAHRALTACECPNGTHDK